MRSGFFPACVLRKASTEGQWEPLSGCTALPRTANNEGTEWCGWIHEPHGDVSCGTKLFLVVRTVIGSFECKVCFVHPESTDCTELFFFLLLKKGKSSWLEEWTCMKHPSHARKSQVGNSRGGTEISNKFSYRDFSPHCFSSLFNLQKINNPDDTQRS